MMSSPLVNGNSQIAVPFKFPLIVLLRHGRNAIFNLQPLSSSPRTLLQLQSSSPTSSLFNLNPPCQLHPSSLPTSTLAAIQIPNPVALLFRPFSFMTAVVCFMLLLPDELLTKIIIHSIKDVVVFHFRHLPAHLQL
jgi:hypothetical protein